MRRKVPFVVAMAAGLVAGSCASTGGPASAVRPLIGWMHGGCIGLPDVDVREGAPVTIVALGSPQSVVATSIVARAQSAETCYPLMDGRREVNLAAGLTFYELDLGQPVELGIGLVQRGAAYSLPAAALLDLNDDGRRDTFTRCATSEGVQFSIGAGAPYAGDPLWSGYYYMGYDTQADCPLE